jgi:flagellar hook protein FlgE
MSLLGSFSSSVNGLLAQSYALSNTSNNLANASTSGYKAATTNFEDVVNSCVTSDSSGTSGAKASTLYQNDSQGTITSATTPTYLAINGNGYFVVKTENGEGPYYTRSGDFTLNSKGDLENSEGYVLWGYSTADPTTLTAVNIPTYLTVAPVATSEVTYTANLNASAADNASSSSDVKIYDTEGTSHTVSYKMEKTADNQWTLSVSSTGGAYDGTTANDYSGSIDIGFSSSGTIDALGNETNCNVVGNTLYYTLTYSDGSTQEISCDLSNISQYTETSGQTVDVASFSQDGSAAGSYSGVSIDTDGNVSVSYTNGVSKNLYTVPIATFVNPDSLQSIAGNAYQATASTTLIGYNTVGTKGAGTLKTSALESSNVDIATEFTELVQTQQVYSANAKAVSTINSMMQTLIQLQSV